MRFRSRNRNMEGRNPFIRLMSMIAYTLPCLYLWDISHINGFLPSIFCFLLLSLTTQSFISSLSLAPICYDIENLNGPVIIPLLLLCKKIEYLIIVVSYLSFWFSFLVQIWWLNHTSFLHISNWYLMTHLITNVYHRSKFPVSSRLWFLPTGLHHSFG